MHKHLGNTLIFAIRHWQRTGHTGDYPELEEGNPDIVEDDDLDHVCEGLNCGTITLHDQDDDIQHWIVSGRRHGADEETVSHIVTSGEEDPLHRFVREVLFAGVADADLPEDIWNDEVDGDVSGWYGGSVFEIPGPPITRK